MPSAHRRTLRRSVSCAAALVFLTLPLAAEEDIITVRVEGRADGVGLSARNAAIANAQTEALEAVLHSMLASADLNPLQPILRNAPKYIRSYDLLRADTLENVIRVEMDVHVREKPLRQDVAAIMLPRLPTPPKILLLMGEQIGNDRTVAVSEHGIAETALRTGLEKLHQDVCGAEALDKLYKQVQLIDIVNGDVETCGKFARASLCDVVIIGTATTTTEQTAPGSNMLRSRATVTLRAFRGSDGKMTDSLTATAAVHGANIRESGEQAVQDACEKLTAEVVVAAALTILSTQTADAVILTVERPGSHERLNEVVKALEGMEHVSQIEELFYSDDLARLRFKYDGPMSHLVRELTSRDYAGEELRVQRVVAREMVLAFPAPH